MVLRPLVASTFTEKAGHLFLDFGLKHGDAENVSTTALRLIWPPPSIETTVSSSRPFADEDMLVQLNAEMGQQDNPVAKVQ